MSRLLLLACSERKRPDAGSLPALERYDGPAYRVLRRYMQSKPRDVPDVYILSAQYGLISGDEPIPAYDRRMTPQRVLELREEVATDLCNIELRMRYQHVFMSAGAVYRTLLSPAMLEAFPHGQFMSATGSQGVQLTQLKAWLYQDEIPMGARKSVITTGTIPVRFTLKGHKYAATSAEAIAVARYALENGVLNSLKPTAWYVLVDGHRIPPKWLVSQLTGLAVGDFHSMDARRVLAQLGMTVRQV